MTGKMPVRNIMGGGDRMTNNIKTDRRSIRVILTIQTSIVDTTGVLLQCVFMLLEKK